jgi:hypothetical protein
MQTHPMEQNMPNLLKAGTRIETRNYTMDNQVYWEPARIARRTKVMGPPETDWYPIRFDADGAVLMCHVERFRVIDNRA